MALNCLSKSEINDLIVCLRDVFSFVERKRRKNPIARRIQFPKVPPALSESIVAQLLSDGMLALPRVGKVLRVDCRTSKADILLETTNGPVRVEVKATGKSAFQNLGPKDINADVLIWLHFDSFFHNAGSKGDVQLFIVGNPGKYVLEKQKISLEKFVKLVEPGLVVSSVNLHSLLNG